MKTITSCLFLILMMAAGSVHAQPANCQASFTYTLDSTGYGVILTNTSVGNFTSVQWSFGDGTGSSAMNPVHYYNMNGQVTICLTIFDAIGTCQSTDCQVITIGTGVPCNAYFSTQISAMNAYFYGSLSGSATATYSWDFGDGAVGTGPTPQHAYTTAGTYNVCVTAVDGTCSSTYCANVTVASPPSCTSNFSFTVSGTTVSFNDLSTGSGQAWVWDFGDGTTSSLQNPVHTYTTSGIYQVCLTIGNVISCYDTYCTTVAVGPNTGGCNAQFGYQNVQMNYYFASSFAATHSWDFGDGTTSFTANPSHTYGGPGTYVVCHTVTDSGCTDTFCDTIYISSGGNCTVSYTFTTDSTNTIFTFTGSTTGTVGQFAWSFGDGTGGTGSTITHSYPNGGTFIVCLSVTTPAGGIICSYCQTITAGPQANPCVPVFYAYPDSNVVGNGNLNFGVSNPCGNTQYTWTFGDGSTGTGLNPVHQYADSGWYYVCVTAVTPNGTFISCDSVYSFRLTSSVAENSNISVINIYPNPAAEKATLAMSLNNTSNIEISLSDISGKISSTIYSGKLDAGLHRIPLSLNGFSSGVYLLLINADGVVSHKKLTLVQ
jgi:PKD repeat protein